MKNLVVYVVLFRSCDASPLPTDSCWFGRDSVEDRADCGQASASKLAERFFIESGSLFLFHPIEFNGTIVETAQVWLDASG